jgi:hypothetical protein
MNPQEVPERAAKSLPKVKLLMLPAFSFFVQQDSVTGSLET